MARNYGFGGSMSISAGHWPLSTLPGNLSASVERGDLEGHSSEASRTRMGRIGLYQPVLTS